MIWTPGYHPESPGTHTLYQLARTLVAQGYPVRLSVHGPEEDLPTALRALPRVADPGPLAANELVVYPELVSGNPLRGHRVIRYLLHAPGPGGFASGATDFVACADPSAADLAFLVRVAPDERDAFHPPPGPRPSRGVALVDLGLGPQGPLPPEVSRFLDGFEQRLVISRYHPGSRARLGALLRQASVLVSVGGSLVRSQQATLCGTPVLLAGVPPDALGRGAFARPEDFAGAAADAAGVFQAYLDELEGNATRVEALVAAASAHFATLERGGAAALPLREASRQAAALRARRFTAVAPAPAPAQEPRPPPAAPAPADGPPPRYRVVDSLNLMLKQAGPLHTALKQAVVRAAGFSTREPSPPVRHQLADTVNRAVKRVPLIHTTLKRAIPRST